MKTMKGPDMFASGFRSAQPKSMKTNEGHGSSAEVFSSSKRARVDSDVVVGEHRKSGYDSFKTKLMSMASPSGSWDGFGYGKEKLKIKEGDIVIVDGPSGLVMKLSTKLKQQLCKT
ncbi:hypothetical protein ACOSQ4_010255 [Xanthoceras sorbifolium]